MIIYTTPKCISCKEVKKYLLKKKIEFEEIDMSKMEQKEQLKLQRKTGRLSVPIIEDNGKFYFSLKELKDVN